MKRPLGPFGRAGEPDPYTIVPKPLSEQVVSELCKLTGVNSPTERAQLKQEVEYWCANYDRWVRQEAVTPSETEQRKMLEAALDSARALKGAVCSALEAPNSYSFLMGAYVSHRDLPSDSTTVSYYELANVDLKHLHRMERVLETALSRWSVPRGPKQRTSVYLLVQGLCWAYEKYSGKKATHNPYSKTAYTSAPQSPVGRFVSVACRELDSHIREPQLSTALSYLVRKKPKK